MDGGLNTPERSEFYKRMEERKNVRRYTFAITFDVDTSTFKGDIEAAVTDALTGACLKPVRVKKLSYQPGEKK